MQKNPLLTVITIVYNNIKHIERTMLSVLNQTYTPIEYIVIDGASTDGTVDIINTYKDKISLFISEKDKGIYHAMNKGLALAKGDYVLFMNSGDEIYAPTTVKNLLQPPYVDIYYGETEMINENLQSLGQRRHKAPDNINVSSFKYGMPVSHQAIYVRTNLASPFNLKYYLSADIDWLLNILQKTKTCCKSKNYVAKYMVGGISKTKHWQSLKERFIIMKTYYGLWHTLYYHSIIALNLAVYWLKNKKTND